MCEKSKVIEEMDANSILREVDEALTMLSPEERAYRIVKSFFENEQPSDKIHTMFFEWMMDPANEEAKQRAIERVFKECLDGTMNLKGSKKRKRYL